MEHRRGEIPFLSKSRFLSGIQCHKRLYLECYERDLAAPIDAATQARFNVGKKVGETLKDWISSPDHRPHPEGHLFVPRKIKSNHGKSKYRETREGCYSKDTFSRLLRAAIKTARKSGIGLPPGFVPKKLRHSFATNLRSMEADTPDLQAYLGHCPPSVLAGHYDVVSENRLDRIAALAQALVAAEK